MNKKIQKIFLVLLLFAFLNMAFAPSARADFWGSAYDGSAISKQTTEHMTKSIYDTIVANLKIAAIRILQAKLFSLLGMNKSTTPGVAGMIISDWKVFIYQLGDEIFDPGDNRFFPGLEFGRRRRHAAKSDHAGSDGGQHELLGNAAESSKLCHERRRQS